MDTVIDVAILMSAYASLSLFCAALLRVVRTEPQRATDESVSAPRLVAPRARLACFSSWRMHLASIGVDQTIRSGRA
jgi:hypothetical protein